MGREAHSRRVSVNRSSQQLALNCRQKPQIDAFCTILRRPSTARSLRSRGIRTSPKGPGPRPVPLGAGSFWIEVDQATAFLDAVADRPLVHIQSDVIHSLYGGASLVVV